MNWQEAMDYLLIRLPMFQRQGPAAYRADLSNILAISDILGNPEKDLRCIHIAGTNGKGSVTHLIAAVLQAAGYRSGIYSSPHYLDYRERIKINGEMIPEDAVIQFLKDFKHRLEKLDASFFEITTGMAFWYFKEMKTEFAVIETGLGGRLDCTNILHPALSVITNIGYDHMNILGETLTAIAAEKAGIIKQGIPVLIGEKQEELSEVFESKAKQCNSTLFYASEKAETEGPFTFKDRMFSLNCPDYPAWNGSYESGLCGAFQRNNYRTAIAALCMMQEKGLVEIPASALAKGLKDISTLTYFMGRFMKMQGHDHFFADSAHNEAGIRMLMESIRSMSFRHCRIAFGTVADKDPGLVLQHLPKDAQYYFCRADQPRAMDADLLREKAADFGLSGQSLPDVNSAILAMLRESNPEDLLLLTGSVFVVADGLKTQPQGSNASFNPNDALELRDES